MGEKKPTVAQVQFALALSVQRVRQKMISECSRDFGDWINELSTANQSIPDGKEFLNFRGVKDPVVAEILVADQLQKLHRDIATTARRSANE